MTAGETPLAELRDLSINFRSGYQVVNAVRDDSWTVFRGEVLAILGESGSGKSVSVSALVGLLDPTGRVIGGKALVQGEDLSKLSHKDFAALLGRKVAMVFQDPLAALNPLHPVGSQIAEMMIIHGVARAEARKRAVQLMERVGIPDPADRARDYPHQFSGGQRQRIVIAMAIAMKPDLLIADEPTSSLDVTVQAQILRLLKELRREMGMGMVLITHDIAVVAEFADRVVVMNNGAVVETGDVATVLRNPQHPYTRKLLEDIPGRKPIPAPRTYDPPPLLEVRHLSKHFHMPAKLFGRGEMRILKALDDVSLSLYRAQTIGIVGESGSGKSTLVRTLLGLETATSGSAKFRDQEMIGAKGEEAKRLKRAIQVVFQDPAASLNPRMTAGEIVIEAWEIHDDVVPRRERRARAIDLLEEVGLRPEHFDRYPHEFSGGQRQRIAIARAIALKPEILICDEAVSALDVSVRAQVMALLARLQRDHGLAYLFIAHDLGLVRDFADQVIVMHLGKVVENGSTRDIFEHPQDEYTRTLIAASPILTLPPAVAVAQ